MKSLAIIECLCYSGCTEHNGTIATEYYDDINTMLEFQFGGSGRTIIYDGVIKPATSYIYAYDVRLKHPKSGDASADAVVEVRNSRGVLLSHIYLYEIEN